MLMDPERLEAALPAYQVGEQIGRRGLGVVFAARHRRLGLQVAVKVLSDSGSDTALQERSLAEATALGELDHPHIVRIHDYVEHDGLCLLIMERLTGGTLGDRPLSGEDACGAGLAVADALAAAHQRGVLHRDIKPENLLYSTDGTLKVVGFGLAKAFDGAASLISGASSSPAYMAPERIQGTRLGPATDVYALGVVLFELLTGRLPFSRELPVASQLHHHLNVPAPPLLGAPPELAAVVARALRKDPGDRHGSAYEFELELAQAVAITFGPDWLDRVRSPLRVSGRVRDAARGITPAAVPAGRPSLVPSRPVNGAGPDNLVANGAANLMRNGATATNLLTGGSSDLNPTGRASVQPRVSRHGALPEAATSGPPALRDEGRQGPAFRSPVEAPERPRPWGDPPDSHRDEPDDPGEWEPERRPWYRRPWAIAAVASTVVVGVTIAAIVIALNNSSTGTSGPINVASPRGLVVDPAGNLYLSDVSNHQVRKITPSGAETVIAGTGAIGSSGDGKKATDAALSYPESLALGPWGSIYIADTAEHRVRQVSATGVMSTVVGADPTVTESDDATDAEKVALPDNFSIAASPDGQLYVVEAGNAGTQRVRRYDGTGLTTVAGNEPTEAGGSSSSSTSGSGAGFGQVSAVAVNSAGQIYVADKGQHVVWMFTPGGRPTAYAGGGTAADCQTGVVASGPEAIALGRSGELYVGSYGLCEFQGGSVRELVRNRYIDAVAAAPDGDVYFISQNTIYKLTRAGRLTAVTA